MQMKIGSLTVKKTLIIVKPKRVIHVGMLAQVAMNVVMSIQEMKVKTIIIAIPVVCQ